MKKSCSISTIIIYIVLIVLAIVWLLPIVASLNAAFKTPQDYGNHKFYELPTEFGLISNLQHCFKVYKLEKHFLSSLYYAIISTSLAIVFSSMAAYSLIRLRPKFSFLLFVLIYSGTIFPFQMYLVPLYNAYIKLGLYNTRFGMILLYTAITIPFSLFVYRGFFTTVPRSIEEAAIIDGCKPGEIYLHIFIPQAFAPTAVVALFQMTWIWNDLLFGMILSKSNEIRPIMVALATMAGIGGGSIPRQMTGVIFTSLPTIALFIGLKKYFIEGRSTTVSLK
jgi:multiple sugar transport system permease protein